ncbi:hypothetical protein AKO1_012074 [Acrasis kona]|uniref:Oxysterol-binding protein n=1 Tax=Acrasis kona TaxID=1008807 RepID=A0AAW2Z9Y7_9EUKA
MDEHKVSPTHVSKEDMISQGHIYDDLSSAESKDTTYGSLVYKIIKELRVGMNLTSITCPIFMIKPRSLLEELSTKLSPHNFTYEITNLKTSEERMLGVVKSTLISMSSTPKKGINNMKPLNPILGERFQCEWNVNGKQFECYSEQVSHHPPISAAIMRSKDNKYVSEVTTAPKPTFCGNYIQVSVDGSQRTTLTDHNEIYDIKMPPFYVCGLVWGQSRVELGTDLTIDCQKSQLRCDVKISGTKITGNISNYNGQELSTITGDLTDKIFSTKQDGCEELIFNGKHEMIRPLVKSLLEQDDMESRRVWHKVAFAYSEGDFDAALNHKCEVEEQQRAIRKTGMHHDYVPKWFECVSAEGGEPKYDFVNN